MGIFDSNPFSLPSGNTIPAPVQSTGGGGNPFAEGIDPFPGQPVSVAGSSTGRQGDIHWRIDTVEPSGLKFKNFSVTGQFPVNEEGIVWKLDQVVPEAATYGLPNPFVQWIRGELQTITIPVVLFSRHKNERVSDIFRQFMRLQTYIPELKRTPICHFAYADLVSMKCIVKGFGDVKIARPTVEGRVRQIQFTITLHKYRPYKRVEIDASKPVKLSRMQTAAGALRMYEALSKKEYGAEVAVYGVELRRLNRQYPFAVPEGGKTKIPRFSAIAIRSIYPEFHGFDLFNEDASNAFLERANKRNELFLVR